LGLSDENKIDMPDNGTHSGRRLDSGPFLSGREKQRIFESDSMKMNYVSRFSNKMGSSKRFLIFTETGYINGKYIL
jgi:hypothetical protein